MAHSPHRRNRGCSMCKPHQWRGQGKARKEPWRVNRMVERRRRWDRRTMDD